VFIETDLSDTVRKNSTPNNLMNLPGIFFYSFVLLNWSGIFEQYSVVSVDNSQSINECTYTDQQQIKLHILGVCR